MTPTEKIAAAIRRLEQFTDPVPEEWAIRLGKTTDVIIAGTSIPVASNLFSWNADLIVTLHHTIDAQLAILRDFEERYAGRMPEDWVPKSPTAINTVALADAILGEST